MTNQGNNIADEVSSQVISCIFAGAEYAANSQIVYQQLSQKSKPYTDAFIAYLVEIFNSAQYPPEAKFYTLYLLVKSTERNNTHLMDRMNKSKDLMRFLFEKVQEDAKKPLGERGFNLFTKTPSKDDSQIGHNFVIFLLEAFKFWGVTYGNSEALQNFKKWYTTLAKKIKFPELFAYVGQEHQLNESFHLIPVEKLPKKDFLPGANNVGANNPEPAGVQNMENVLDGLNQEEEKEPERANPRSAALLEELLEVISSGFNFELGHGKILSAAKGGSADHNQALLEGIANILESEATVPTSKFYALYLLVKITETQNEVFNKQLANNQKLLNKLLKDGNYDNEKPEAERGLTLFTQNTATPDAYVGKNYVTLLLEAVQFWGRLYKSAEKGSTFYKFRMLYSSLIKTAKIPKEATFVGKKINAASAQNNQSLSKIGYTYTMTASLGPTNKFIGVARTHVDACVKSGEDYLRNVPIIVSNLEGQYASEYFEGYFMALQRILESMETTPKAKLYALWLLVKTTEQKNPAYIDALAQKQSLLNLVFQAAQLDYEKPFENKGLLIFPESQVIGNKYVNVSIEALKYWSQTYGSTNESHPRHLFNDMYVVLEEQMKFPQRNTYIGTSINTDVMTIGPEAAGQRPWEQYEKQPEARPIPAADKSKNVQNVEAGFRKLNEAKVQLKGFFESNPKENPEMDDLLEYFIQDVNQTMQDSIQPNIEGLIGTQAGEKYVTQAFEEGDAIKRINEEYARYKAKKTSYSSFRSSALGLLNSSRQQVGGEPKQVVNAGISQTGSQLPRKREPDEIPEDTDFVGYAGGGGGGSSQKKNVKGQAMAPLDFASQPKMRREEEIPEESAFSGPAGGRSGQKRNVQNRDVAPNVRGQSSGPGGPSQQKPSQDRPQIQPLPLGGIFSGAAMNVKDKTELQMSQTKKSSNFAQEPKREEIKPVQTQQQVQPNPFQRVDMRASYGRGNTSGSKAPIIMGVDSIPLSKGAHIETEESRSISPQRDSIMNRFVQSPSPTTGFGKEKDQKVNPLEALKNYVVSQASKTYLMETRFKWLSHYRFKAGGLQEDREDPIVQVQRLRAEELQDDDGTVSKIESPMKEIEEENSEEKEEEKVQELEKQEEEKQKKGRVSINTDANMKESFLTSMKSPVNRRSFETDLSNIEKGIRSSSKVRASELAKIENSLRASMHRSGKKIPENQTIKDMEAREEMDKELQKLRQENGRLMRENNYLKSEGAKEADKSMIEEMKQLLAQYDAEVSYLKEELSIVKDENERISQKPQEGIVEENKTLKKKLDLLTKELEKIGGRDLARSISGEGETEKRAGTSRSSSQKRPIFEKVNYEKPQFLMTKEPKSFRNTMPVPQVMTFAGLKSQEDEESSSKRYRNNFMSPQPEESNKRSGYRAGYDTSPRSQESIPRSRGNLLVGLDSPETNGQRVEKPVEYVPNSGEKGKGEDSEFDIKGMISSRKDEGQKEIRGKEIRGDVATFAKFKDGSLSNEDLLKFRMACLKNKCPLFDNNVIQIGVVSTVVHDNSGQRNILKLALYYGNKTKTSIEGFRASVGNAQNITKLVKPEILEGIIEPGKQLKQQVAVSFKASPFDCLQIDAGIAYEEESVDFRVFLPSVITKFMEFKYVSTEDFRERWKPKTQTVLKTGEIELDPIIVKSTYDFKKYFGYLVDLKPMDEYDFVQGKKGIKLGGLFELDVANVDYMLKINLMPGHKVVFQIACPEEKTDIATFLLQTLKFLFQKIPGK